MPVSNMPAAEVEIDADLVQALLTEQHPDLAGQPIVALTFGWDNVIYRLGDDLVVRLPRRAMAAPLVEHEQRWLPQLAPGLPLPIPAPVRAGHPSPLYPWHWSVCPWLPGAVAAVAPPEDMTETAGVLGRFVAALHGPAPTDAPVNPFRGRPLRDRDGATQDRLTMLDGIVDSHRALRLWRHALTVPPWEGPPLWLHGDLHPANMLVDAGRLSAVIDFGDMCGGDPATDLAVMWMLFPPDVHDTFRRAAGDVDDDTWQRAEGWALALGLAYVAGSADNAVMHRLGMNTIKALLGG